MYFTLDYEKYAQTARRAAAEGCVLLKNEENALPIQKDETVSIFGRIQFTYYKSGTGSGGMVNAPWVADIPGGLKKSGLIQVNGELEEVYRAWIAEHPFDMGEGWAKEPWCQEEMPVTSEMAQRAAARSDLALVILGRTAGEDNDNSAQPGSYLLTQAEEELLANVCGAFSRTVVVLNVGNIIDMKWVEKYHPQAVLYAWQGGMEGGNGVADVLCGRVNPCGKLSDTIAYDIADYPSAKNFGDGRRNYYTEDIYVGYRYFETFAKDKVLYPFGFGLSYTKFAMEVTGFETVGGQAAGADAAEGCSAGEAAVLSFHVRVRNTGGCPGREVAQLYVGAPQGRLGKPARSLARFAKTSLLKPGEEELIVLTLPLSEAASYDDGGVTGNKSCWVLEAGEYHFYIGSDVRNAALAGSVVLDRTAVVEKLAEAMAPVLPFERLKVSAGGENGAASGCYKEDWESVPLRTADLAARIGESLPEFGEYTGDRGFKLADAAGGKISLREFLAQLTDEELSCMTRGEGMCSPKVTPGTAAAFGGVTKRLSDYGIPVACCSDGPSGIRMDCGTPAFSLPGGTLLSCTFDTNLVEQLFEMEGMELRKNKIDTLLGPGMNIHRNPLNGRNFEYFSEDPYLTGKMAAAELKGMGKYGVTGTIKHFACNNQEYKRHDADAVVSERALREIYLKGFEMAVKEGHAYSIMSTYGPVNGIWTAGNYDLLTEVLRRQWGYQGMVMTDWWAKMNDEGCPGERENTAAMVRAQNDVYMVVSDSESNSGGDNTLEGLKNGVITRAQLLRNAENICRFLMASPVMGRFTGKETDVCEELHGFSADHERMDLVQRVVVGDECRLKTDISTKRGSGAGYSLRFHNRGAYVLHLKMRSDAGELAQLPVSVSMNNQLIRTVTITGTDGNWTEHDVEFEVFAALENYLKLFFGESGIEFGEISVHRRADG